VNLAERERYPLVTPIYGSEALEDEQLALNQWNPARFRTGLPFIAEKLYD